MAQSFQANLGLVETHETWFRLAKLMRLSRLESCGVSLRLKSDLLDSAQTCQIYYFYKNYYTLSFFLFAEFHQLFFQVLLSCQVSLSPRPTESFPSLILTTLLYTVRSGGGFTISIGARRIPCYFFSIIKP